MKCPKQKSGGLLREGTGTDGSQLNTDFGLDMLDYGARWYDPSIARFHTIDPLAENYSFQNPFAYAANNPIKFIDFMGMGPTSTHVDEDNNVIASFDDGDNNVYMHENGTTESDIVEYNYYESANRGVKKLTDGGGTQVSGTEVTISATPIDAKTKVTSTQWTGTFIVGLGVTGGKGTISDTKGNEESFTELGVGWGFDISFGKEVKDYKNLNLPEFDVYSIDGAALDNNLSLPGLDITWGGDQDRVGFDHIGNPAGRNVKSNGYGVSIGPPGFSQTSSHTWVPKKDD